jgi:predicted nucleotidyltransferase
MTEEEEAYEEALRRIREAEENGAVELGLGLELNRLPPELECLTSLQSLDLSWCEQLSDLSPLASLTSLQTLDLSWCKQLNDLSPLAGLTSLQSLDLHSCKQLSDLTPLAGLTSIRRLRLSECLGVRRFAPLESLLPSLETLNLHCCKLDDLPPEVSGANEDVLDKVRAYFQRPVEAQKAAQTGPSQPLVTPSHVFVSTSGDTSPNASEKDRQRQEVVERLCRTLDQTEILKFFCNAVLAWSDSNCQILVFGSYANEQYRVFSDIDVAVISEKFKGQGWQQRIAKLMEFLPQNSVLIKPIGITPDEKTHFDYPSIIRTIRRGPTRDIWI